MVAQVSRGFTLVELLVVILIILSVSAVALPVVLPAIRQRQANEAARILSAALGGARDAAISNNAPRGIRLLPDPVLTQPPVGTSNAGTTTWASNRFIPIEPAPDYHEGYVRFDDPLDTYKTFLVANGYRRYANAIVIAQSHADAASTPGPAPLTSWAWNIRVGDKIRINNSGHPYTVIGPVGPSNDTTDSVSQPNPENFINYGDPSTAPILLDTGGLSIEFLFLVNGVDDDGDGFVDNSFDGYDNDFDGTVDNPFIFDSMGNQIQNYSEYEPEVLLTQEKGWRQVAKPIAYTIQRRPTPSRGARETMLPSNVVIDFTTWNRTTGLAERSRLPYAFNANARYVDVLINPNGQTVSDTTYAVPTSANVNAPFFHFWLTDREGVVAPAAATLVDTTNVLNGQDVLLPIPPGASSYPSTTPQLTGQRMLVSIFARTGYTTVTSLENFFTSDGLVDVNAPFIAAQQGVKESP